MRAQEQAREHGSPTIGAEHLLYGVLTDAGGAPAVVLRRHGVDARRVSALDDGTGLDHEALSASGSTWTRCAGVRRTPSGPVR
ncbi:MAG: Clp protease N-terminal domain-containing protein, partial [Janthinobacterium lividum]